MRRKNPFPGRLFEKKTRLKRVVGYYFDFLKKGFFGRGVGETMCINSCSYITYVPTYVGSSTVNFRHVVNLDAVEEKETSPYLSKVA